MRRLAIGPATLLAAFLVATPPPALACSCTNNLTLEQEYGYSPVVFSGRVLSIQADPFGSLAVEFEPITRWKGPLQYVQLVVTPLNSAGCGYEFEVGREYLVFASMYGYGITYTPTPFTHSCSRTSPLIGNEYIAQLPPPLLPTPAARSAWGSLKVRYR